MTRAVATKKRTMTASHEDPAHRDHMISVANTLKATTPFPSSDQQQLSPIERINERELHSLYALLAYVSYNQNVCQETVQMIVEAQFGVDHVAKINRGDYMRAVEFLVDLKMNEIVN